MARPQFSLLRLMGAVTCFAVGLGALSFLLLHEKGPGRWEMTLVSLVFVMPGAAVAVLAGRFWIGALVSVGLFLGFLLFLLSSIR